MTAAQPLPDALQGWRPWLSWFTPELAAEVGELLKRMHPLLGRFRGSGQGGACEPDGVEDLRNRGSYERLLSSEWLLATELPDEFLRRATGGEHLFLAPRMRPRQADKLIVAVFDIGPWLLGAPRLAQLALWILLARRAAEAGGELRWGAAHLPGQWRGADSPSDLKHLLRLRTLESAGAAHWQQWSDWLDANASGVGESWLIGHDVEAMCRLPSAPTHAVRVRLGLDGQALDLSLRLRGSLGTVRLPLPPPEPAELLLRGRFQRESPPDAHRTHSERLSLRFAPIVAHSGTQVAVPLLDGHGVMVFKLHRGTKKDRQQAKPRRMEWSADAHVLAAAFSGKALGAVLSRNESLHFWQMPELGVQPRPPREVFEAPPGRASLLACQWHRSGSQTCAFLLDAAGRLVSWNKARTRLATKVEAGEDPRLVDAHVLAMASCGDAQIAFVCKDVGQLWLRVAGLGTGPSERNGLALSISAGPDSKAFVSGKASWNKGYASCAVRVSNDVGGERWRVFEASTSFSEGISFDAWEAVAPPGAQAIGLVCRTRSPGHALVVQEANRSGFLLLSTDGCSPMYKTPGVVERVSVCPSSGMVAMLTRNRELHVYSTADQSMRMVAHSGDSQGASADA